MSRRAYPTRRAGTPEEQVIQRVDVRGLGECWPWLAYIMDTGYGQVRVNGRLERAHRWVYEIVKGPIPAGLEIDHTCHNVDKACPGGNDCPHRACCNPAHLEAVPHAVNSKRGRPGEHLSKLTHCKRGHPFDAKNTILRSNGYRGCRACKRMQGRESARRVRARGRA